MYAVFDADTSAESDQGLSVGGMIARLGVALFFGIFGLEKFSSAPDSEWVGMFHRIGFGDWFRYFTGVVEMLGAMLVLIPRTFLIGLWLLAATMFGAVVIVALLLHAPGDSAFPGIFLLALVVMGIVHLRQ
jgi:putative oxidoreductase